MKKQTIKCECGNQIDTSNNPQIEICPQCNRRYGKQAPKLKLLGVGMAHTFFGAVLS